MKRLVCIIVIITALSGIAISAQPYEGRVEVQYGKVYERADTDSEVLRTLTKGVQVKVIEIGNDWCLVEVNERRGWILTRDISIKSEGNEYNNVSTEEVKTDYEEPMKVYSAVPLYKVAEFSIKGGLSFAKLAGDDVMESFDNESETRMGLLGGLSFTYHFSPYIGLMPELLYAMKGGMSNYDGEESTIHLNYFEIPVLLRFSLGNNLDSEPFVNIGPVLSINHLSVLEKDSGNNKIEDVKGTDIGIAIGAGVSKKFGNNSLFFEGRYTFSTGSIHDADKSGIGDLSKQLDIKNQAIYLIIGISFTLSEK